MEKRICKIILAILLIFSMAFMAFYVITCIRYYASSDYAMYVMLAKEQLNTGQLFPDGFHYSTGLFIFSINLAIIPLLTIIDNWIVCRQIGVAIYVLIAIIMSVVFFNTMHNEKHKTTLSSLFFAIFFFLPLSFTQVEEWFFEAGYLGLAVQEFFALIFFFKIAKLNKKMHYIFLMIATCISCLEGTRNILIISIPLIGALIIYQIIENFKDLSGCFKDKSINLSILSIIIGTGIGYIGFSVLSKHVALNDSYGNSHFTDSWWIANNVDNFINRICVFFGASGTAEIVSVKALCNMVNFAFLVITVFIVPIIYLKNYKKITNKLLKLYTLFFWISNLLTIYMMLFIDFWSCNPTRYFLTVYFNLLILLALGLTELLEHNDKGMLYLITLVIVGFVSINDLNVYNSSIKPVMSQENENDTMIDFLKQNNLTYGYATFWNAYKYTLLSNGDVSVAAFDGIPNRPYQWLTSDKYYDPNIYQGRCFILLSADESIPEIYYERAVEVLEYNNCRIYIYDNNIYSYEEFNAMNQ